MRPTATILRDDPKLARIADALRETFGPRLTSALLFGSRARGDHRPDSDYDVAVFLNDLDREKDREVLARVRERLGEEVWTLQFWPFAPDGLAARTTLMFNIRNEAVQLPGLDWPGTVSPSISPDAIRPTPEAVLLMTRAESEMNSARKISAIGIHGSAAREAYRAALLAARALIFEELMLAPHTHSQTQELFVNVAIKPRRISRKYAATLDEGYKIQIDNDYETISSVSDERAVAFIAQAADLIAGIKALLNPGF